MIKCLSIFIFCLWTCLLSFSQNVDELFEKGNYKKVIELTKDTKSSDFKNLNYRINAYSRMNFQKEYFQAVSRLKEDKSICVQILYNTHLSKYYQQMMFVDSSLYHADKAMKLYSKRGCTDSSIVSFLYTQYANAMRNGSAYFEVIKNAANDYDSYEKRNEFLESYFDTALYHAQSDYQRADIYRKIGTMYSDGVPRIEEEPQIISFSVKSIDYLRKSINLESSPADKAMAHALIGLNYLYSKNHRKAEVSFENALKLTKTDNRVIYPHQFIIISDWRGENLERIYQQNNDEELLNLANDVYSRAFKVWSGYYKGRLVHDSYHNSSINRLVNNHLELFKATSDSSHIFKAFDFMELSKYPNFQKTKNTIQQVQKLLDENTAFVNYATLNRPNRHIAFVITKGDFYFVEMKSNASLAVNKLSKLYDFIDIDNFKYWSYRYYENYFKKVDSILYKEGTEKLIISNSDWLSMLNLDVLISDTIGSKWKDLEYLFHRYNISYALSASAYLSSLDSRKKTNPRNLGISLGSYTKEANLRFSEKLKNRLLDTYVSKELKLFSNIKSSSIALLMSHGESSYFNKNAYVKTSSIDSISSGDIERMNLSNDLVVFNACNTNASQQYYSEGAIGNFNVAFRSAGSSTVLTTSWAIDDQTNAFIMERFIHHLSNGMNKSESLWRAKKDYWKQALSDDELKPLYWAPYVLTGNVNPIEIRKRGTDKEKLNYYWFLLLLIVPLGILFKNRLF